MLSCDQQQGDPVVQFEEDNPEMSAAIEEARQSLATFISHLEEDPTDETALIKAPIDTGSQVEHIWVGNLQFDGQQFTGQFANEPFDLSRYKQGDTVSVPQADISDWAFIDGNEMIGGYTIKVMEKRMTE
ncbi:MAG: DUF2314 domain-containing protein [Planctomycetaceae bacterium]|nr:DUF2314 domain-containing protein [Planctomycetaceae bacterium]